MLKKPDLMDFLPKQGGATPTPPKPEYKMPVSPLVTEIKKSQDVTRAQAEATAKANLEKKQRYNRETVSQLNIKTKYGTAVVPYKGFKALSIDEQRALNSKLKAEIEAKEDAKRKPEEQPKATIDPYNPGEVVTEASALTDIANRYLARQPGIQVANAIGQTDTGKSITGGLRGFSDSLRLDVTSPTRGGFGTDPQALLDMTLNLPSQVVGNVANLFDANVDNVGKFQSVAELGADALGATEGIGRFAKAIKQTPPKMPQLALERGAKPLPAPTRMDALGGYPASSFEEFRAQSVGTPELPTRAEVPKALEANNPQPAPKVDAQPAPMSDLQPNGVNMTAGAVRFTEEVRKQFDLPGRTKPSPQTMKQWAEEAQSVDVDGLLNRIETADRPTATAPEQVALGAKMSELQDELDALGDQYREAAKTGTIPDELSDRMDSARSRLQRTIEASEAVGTETSRTFNARKALVKADYSVAGIIKKQVRELKKAGKKASPEDVAFAEAQANRIKELEDKLAALPQEKPTVGERRRAVRKATLEKEAESIINQIKALGEKKAPTPTMRGRQGGAINVGKLPQYMDLYAQYAANLAKRGYSTVDDIFADVIKVAKEAGHNLSKQELVDAMDGWYLKNSGKKLSAAQRADLNARAKLKKEIETGSTRGQQSATAKAQEKAAIAQQRAAELESRRSASSARRQADIAAQKAKSATKAEDIRKYRAEEKAKRAEASEIMANFRATGGTAKQVAADARKATQARLNEALKANAKADNLRAQIEKLATQAQDGSLPAPKRQEIDARVKALEKLRAQALKEAQDASIDVNMQREGDALLSDSNAIARLKAKKDDLDAMLKSGDFWGTGKAKTTSSLSEQRDLLQWQVDQAKKQVDQHIDDLARPAWVKAAREIIGVPRFLELGLDAGALMRQNWDVLFTNPTAWWRGAKAGTKATFNPRFAREVERKFMNDPEVMRMTKEGLEIDGANNHPEYFVSQSLNKIPGFGAAERFHKTSQNVARYEMGKAITKNAKLDSTQRKEAFKLVNAMTGRGNAEVIKNSQILNVFTAPRMYAGQAEMMTAGFNLRKMTTNPAYRKIVLRRTLGRLAVIGGLYEAAQISGNTFGIDPDQPDFLNLTVNGVQYDLGGGYTPYYRLIFRTLNDFASDKNEDGVMDKKSPNLDKNIQQMLTYKLNPAVQTALGMAKGKDAIGNPYFRGRDGNVPNDKIDPVDVDSLLRTFAPMIGQELREMMKSEDYDRNSKTYQPGNGYKDASTAQKAASLGLSFAGASVKAFKPEENKKFEKSYFGQLARAYGISPGR